jgi:Ca2+-binding RTX toxin-like protein
MNGGGGNDTYYVDNAGDAITGEVVSIFGLNFNNGTDSVITTLSSYTLGTFIENLTFAGTGNFTGIGNASANTMMGGAGDDLLTGGAGADAFRFGANFGNDVITDFVAAGAGQERLDVRGLGLTAADFGTAITVVDSGAGAVISMAGGTVTLTGVTAANITTADFIFS